MNDDMHWFDVGDINAWLRDEHGIEWPPLLRRFPRSVALSFVDSVLQQFSRDRRQLILFAMEASHQVDPINSEEKLSIFLEQVAKPKFNFKPAKALLDKRDRQTNHPTEEAAASAQGKSAIHEPTNSDSFGQLVGREANIRAMREILQQRRPSTTKATDEHSTNTHPNTDGDAPKNQ